MMKTLIGSTIATLALSTTAAMAQAITDIGGGLCTDGVKVAACSTFSTAVPEISALEGTAALAALAAIVLIAWERRRRAV